MNKFVKFNANPKGNSTEDCVIRAFSKALNKHWDIVFRDLCDIAFEKKLMPNSDGVLKEYLIRNNFEKIIVSNKKGSTRPKVNTCNLQGTYILRLANHTCCLIDNKYFDIWDCGHKSIYTIYRLK